MPEFCEFGTARRRFVSWQGLLVCLAILCLDAHLAHRFHLLLSGTTVVQARPAKVQHMDRDAYRWVPPVRRFSFSLSPVLEATHETEALAYLSLRVRSLYGRSPPILF